MPYSIVQSSFQVKLFFLKYEQIHQKSTLFGHWVTVVNWPKLSGCKTKVCQSHSSHKTVCLCCITGWTRSERCTFWSKDKEDKQKYWGFHEWMHEVWCLAPWSRANQGGKMLLNAGFCLAGFLCSEISTGLKLRRYSSSLHSGPIILWQSKKLNSILLTRVAQQREIKGKKENLNPRMTDLSSVDLIRNGSRPADRTMISQSY